MPWADAVAIRGGRVAAVGSLAEVRDAISGHADEVDLPGRLVIPGFQDSHCHPPSSGLERMRCDLTDLTDLGEVTAKIAAYASSHPEVEWILGGGWSMETFPGGTPSKEVLDRIVPDRPAFMPNRDGHSAWVNSRALEMAGVDASTPDPEDGRIERLPDGSPQGTLHEGSMVYVHRLVPPTSREDLRRGMQIAVGYLNSLGITGWQDAIVGDPQWGDTLETYVDMATDGSLTARVEGAIWWRRDQGIEQVERIKTESAKALGAGRFRARSVKMMLDGVLENFTGALLDPYLDPSNGDGRGRGIEFIPYDQLSGFVTRLDAEGFQVHMHAIGDRAVRAGLDACEAALTSNGDRDLRHHIAHIQVIHPDDVARFGKLGVVANGQPYWACLEPQMTELTIPFLGEERTGWQYPFRSILDSGGRLAFGSDWSVSTANPLLEMEVAVTRVAPDERDNEPFLPHERISLTQAMEAFTLGSAYVNHLDTETGSIEVGKYADLAVLDHDVFASDAGPVGDAHVVATFFEGEPVYSVPGVL
jgi:predicted amidohydrolase YtcJ